MIVVYYYYRPAKIITTTTMLVSKRFSCYITSSEHNKTNLYGNDVLLSTVGLYDTQALPPGEHIQTAVLKKSCNSSMAPPGD